MSPRAFLGSLPLLGLAALGLPWASRAARLPESWAARAAAGETSMPVDFERWTAVQDEPAHLLARLVHLAVLHVPGVSIAHSAYANAALAACLVLAVVAAFTRAFGLSAGGRLGIGAATALLLASPAAGADWLHGERVGLFLAPLLLVLALRALQGDGRLPWRVLAAIGCAGAAPFAHTHGALVFVAVLPALLACLHRHEARRPLVAIGSLLLVGNLAAVVSLVHVPSLSLGEHGLGRAFVTAPLATAASLLRHTGACWPDLLPGRAVDGLVLGIASWLAPLVLWRFGDRSQAARSAAAPFWALLWFGLLVVVANAERHGLEVPGEIWREHTYGCALLPLGLCGVLAARCGGSWLPFGAGVLVVLGLQLGSAGLPALRSSQRANERLEAHLALPESLRGVVPLTQLPRRSEAEMQAFVQRGWCRSHALGGLAVTYPAAAPLAAPALGGLTEGDRDRVQGRLGDRMFGAGVAAVVLMVERPGQPTPTPVLVWPTEVPEGGMVAFAHRFANPVPPATRLTLLGVDVRGGRLVQLGPVWVQRDGVFAAEGS